MRQKRSLKPETGEPVILRCQPYKIPLTELLLPHNISPVEYFRPWPSLPAIVEYTGTYTYEGSGFKATAAQQYGASPFLSGLKSLSSKPFHRVCSHIIRTVAGFQDLWDWEFSWLLTDRPRSQAPSIGIVAAVVLGLLPKRQSNAAKKSLLLFYSFFFVFAK